MPLGVIKTLMPVKVKPVDMYSSSLLRRSGMTCVNEQSQFYLSTTRGMSYTCRRASRWPVLISHPEEGRRLSWPGRLAVYQDGIRTIALFNLPTTCLIQSAAEHHRTLAGTYFRHTFISNVK